MNQWAIRYCRRIFPVSCASGPLPDPSGGPENQGAGKCGHFCVRAKLPGVRDALSAIMRKGLARGWQGPGKRAIHGPRARRYAAGCLFHLTIPGEHNHDY